VRSTKDAASAAQWLESLVGTNDTSDFVFFVSARLATVTRARGLETLDTRLVTRDGVGARAATREYIS
jgi:hypothetical protein